MGDQGKLPSLTSVAPAEAAAAAALDNDDDVAGADGTGVSTIPISWQGGEGRWTVKNGGRLSNEEASTDEASDAGRSDISYDPD